MAGKVIAMQENSTNAVKASEKSVAKKRKFKTIYFKFILQLEIWKTQPKCRKYWAIFKKKFDQKISRFDEWKFILTIKNN